MSDVMQDEFKALAQKVEQEERDRANKKGNVYTPNYEKLKWTGLEKGKMKILRGLGGVPNSGKDQGTSRTVRIAKYVNDKGKPIRVILPMKEDDPNHILWRVIDRITSVEWIDKTKVFTYEKTQPDIFAIINHNNLPAEDNKRKYGLEGRGWLGREYFVMNCIDRTPEMYEWSKENKHAVLLSKNIATYNTPDGKILEFPEEGVPAFGFTNILATSIFKYYGDWSNYDIGVERTGLMQPSMRLVNASKHIEEIPEDIQDHVVNGPLSDEEKEWELYNLDRLFNVTTATKLWNNLRLTFMKIDAALGSHYSEELKSLADEEAKAREEAKGSEQKEEVSQEATSSVHASVEVPAQEEQIRRQPVEADAAPKASLPPSYESLSEEEKSLITSASVNSDGTWNIEYNTSSKKYACPNCKAVSPEEFTMCPVCGLKF